MRKFFSEFEKFISRGNVLDLAVAVIIGAAFSNIVNSLVKDIVNPILGVLVGRPDFTNLFLVLKEVPDYSGPWTYEELTKAGATVFGYGAFLTQVIQFLLLAFVIFWLIKVVTGARSRIEEQATKLMNKLEGTKAEEPAAEPAPAPAPAPEPAPAPAPAPAAAVDPETVEVLREIRDLLKAAAEAKKA